MPPWGGWSFPCHCVVSSPWQHPPPSPSHLSSQPRPRTISFWCRSSPLSSPLGSRTDKPFSRPPELRAKPNQPLRQNPRSHPPDQAPLSGEQRLATCIYPRAYLCCEASKALPVLQPLPLLLDSPRSGPFSLTPHWGLSTL